LIAPVDLHAEVAGVVDVKVVIPGGELVIWQVNQRRSDLLLGGSEPGK
jgi:hypothetical protein